MPSKYLIDTNILIDHLNGDSAANTFLRDVETGRLRATISVITECELLSGSVMTVREEREILDLLTLLPSVAVTSHVARLGAQLRRRYSMTVADALIAATAIRGHATLVTRNIKDFRSIKDLRLHSI